MSSKCVTCVLYISNVLFLKIILLNLEILPQ